MRKQLVDAAVQLRGKTGEHVLEVCPRIMAIELGRLHQAHHDRSTMAGEFASAEQPCFSAHCPGTDQILAMVVIYLHVAVDQVVRERGTRVEAVVQRPGRRTAVRHPRCCGPNSSLPCEACRRRQGSRRPFCQVERTGSACVGGGSRSRGGHQAGPFAQDARFAHVRGDDRSHAPPWLPAPVETSGSPVRAGAGPIDGLTGVSRTGGPARQFRLASPSCKAGFEHGKEVLRVDQAQI